MGHWGIVGWGRAEKREGGPAANMKTSCLNVDFNMARRIYNQIKSPGARFALVVLGGAGQGEGWLKAMLECSAFFLLIAAWRFFCYLFYWWAGPGDLGLEVVEVGMPKLW